MIKVFPWASCVWFRLVLTKASPAGALKTKLNLEVVLQRGGGKESDFVVTAPDRNSAGLLEPRRWSPLNQST